MDKNYQPEYLCAIDIGSSAVRCVIARKNLLDTKNLTPQIIGFGSSANSGYRKGVAIDVQDVAVAIDSALAQAERMSGTKIDSASFSINGSHIRVLPVSGVASIENAENIITELDILKSKEAASIVQLEPNQQVLEIIPVNFILDGKEKYLDPIGLEATRLELQAMAISISSPIYRNLEKIVEIVGLNMNSVQIPSRASSEALLSKSQKEHGCVLIDLGAQTTNMIVYEEGEFKHLSVIPIGSQNITSDLAIGLRIEIELAEKLKIESASAVKTIGKMKDRQRVFQIEYKGHTHAFQSRDVDMIVGARIEEIFSRVRQELLSIGKSNNLSAGVILCGGGSNLKDIDLAVSRILQLPVKICDMSSYKTPNLVPLDIEWATAVGLILFDDTSIGLGSSQINNNTKNIKHAKKVISNFSKLISFRSKNKK